MQTIFTLLEVPAQPLDVKVLDVWARSASIRWSAPYTGNSPLTLYRVQYWRDKRTYLPMSHCKKAILISMFMFKCTLLYIKKIKHEKC